MLESIKSAVQNTLSIAKVKGTIIVTPSTISIEDISTEAEALNLENAFIKSGMKSTGVVDMAEIEMGEGFCLTIAI